MISGFWIRVFVSLPIVFLFLLAGAAVGQTADFGLFVPADDAGLPAASTLRPAGTRPLDDGLTVRYRRVLADPAAFRALSAALDTGGNPTPVRLNLFPGVVAESVVEWADLTANGYSWGGGVAGDPFGSAAMAVNGDVVRGVVRTGGREYEIRRDGGALLIVRELSRPTFRVGTDDVAPLSDIRSLAPVLDSSEFQDSGRRVDVAFFYTAAAELHEGGPAAVHALIDSWVADVNAAYRRSGIWHRLNTVYRGRAPRPGNTSDWSDTWLCRGEVLPASCRGIAAEFGADLVHTIVEWDDLPDDEKNCGRAFLFYGRIGAPLAGVTRVRCGSTAFAHEIGHNHGARHDRYQRWMECGEDEQDQDVCFASGEYAPPYRYGYVNQFGFGNYAGSRPWTTIMSYATQCADQDVFCDYPMRFSNPQQKWLSDPFGVYGSMEVFPYTAAGDAARRGPADVSRTHREMSRHVANLVARSRPDLVVKGVRLVDDAVPDGGVAALDAVVENLGTPIDSDNVLESFVEENRSGRWTRIPGAWTASVPNLPAEGRASVELVFGMTSARRSRSLRVCADAPLGETLTENNCSGPIRSPDLLSLSDVVVDLSLLDDAALAGSRIGASLRVRNLSTSFGTPPASLGLFYYTRDWGEGGYSQVESFNVPALPPSGSHGFTGTLNVVRTGQGAYSAVYACVYPAGAPVPDPQSPGDDAQCARAPLRGVEDILIVTTGPASVTTGQVFWVDVRVKNYAPAALPSGSVRLERWQEFAAHWGEIEPVGTKTFSEIPSGGTRTFAYSATAADEPGVWDYWALVCPSTLPCIGHQWASSFSQRVVAR